MRASIRVAIIVSVIAHGQAFAEDWPQWRGAAGTGASTETGLPSVWSDSQNVAWKASLRGVGVSSPIVSRNLVVVTSQSGQGASRQGPRLGQGADASSSERSLAATGTSEAVRFFVEAFDRASGRRAWTFELPAEGELPAVHDKHNLASASPVSDGERIYAIFGTGQVVAVDTSGTQAWTRNLAKEYGPFDINWGHGSSPIVHGTTLYLVCYHESASYLLAVDSRTGRTLWKVDRPRGVISYSTPSIVRAPQGDELVVNSSVGIEAYDPGTGRPLWEFAEPNQFPIPVAMQSDGILYWSRGYRSGPFAAIRPGGHGEISKTNVVWHVPTGAPYISSLVHYDGLLYMAGDTGIVSCIDAKTGQAVWRERLGGIYTASPVAGDGKVYLVGESGETIVLRAGRTPQVVSKNKINGRILASPAIAGGRIFIRADNQVVAIGS